MSDSSIILAIDTATGPCSAAVLKAGKIAAYAQDQRTVTQSVSLMPMVERVLAESNTEYRDLTLVAASVGPGSFTGIRVGLAAARGICFSAGTPGVGINTLDILAFGAICPSPLEGEGGSHSESGEGIFSNISAPHPTPPPQGGREYKILAILNAGKGEVYYRTYCAAPFSPLGETQVGTLEAAKASAPEAYIVSNMEAAFPRADALAALAAAHAQTLDIGMHPFYLRAPDAKLPASPAS